MRSVLFVSVAILALQASAPAMAFSYNACAFGLLPESISCVTPNTNDRNDGKGMAAERSFEKKDKGNHGHGHGRGGRGGRGGHGGRGQR